MRDWLKALSLVGLIAGVPLAHAQEEGEGEVPVLTDADQAALAVMNAAIINGHILPAYRAFAAGGAALAAAAKAYCTAPDAAGLTKLRAAFGDASDGWQGVQHLRFGPSELFMRSSRLFFWPDPRDSVGRQLNDLLVKNDAAAFTPANLAKQSVSVQGLPALERLLFGDEAATLQCAAIQGIADNIAGLTADLATDWTAAPIDYARILLAPGPDNERYRSPSEVTMELFKSLHLAVEVVADRKLTKALGENAAAARPRLLEQWRSGRPLRNLELDLAAAKALWGSGMSAVVKQRNAPLAALVDKALAQTIASAGAITPPLETALADPARRAAVETVVNEAVALKSIIAQQLAPVLGIPLGFNALDGD
ncbi:hypothetical protein D3874_13960 [Oleomonas cavernae]|uniref:Imelysin-like domain-containing protein n=1 Tax=Oleomonas cavernae TaxID=2320859 RepID=A0A418WDC0_9PROT|nr:imelysin family protein [Oleomonas cavernae]RJF87990.1 hypothetical protein D3874_13960 [Oleomonas cavernae]